ncbi:MAG: MotA/TolQ/ExbB proton channel family protein [Verrucomicrobiae bacterium]|nr:MotA/TolQ/ExbB proton channel family protein [Verrucomicrobiae bacterium]
MKTIEHVVGIWARGGWVMWPLAVIAVSMFWVGLRLFLDLRRRQRGRVHLVESHDCLRKPELAGEIGMMIKYALAARSPAEVRRRFAEIAAAELHRIELRLSVLRAFVAAAPLVGLLGTVFGMLVTFQALATTGGGKITEAMASGISKALFPPEVGLCVALPGLLLAHLIQRQKQEFEAFLARMESRAIQHFRSIHKPALSSREGAQNLSETNPLYSVETPA